MFFVSEAEIATTRKPNGESDSCAGQSIVGLCERGLRINVVDTAGRFVIVPRRRLYWIEAVHHDGSRRAIEFFRDESAAVERLRTLQLQQEKMELRLHARQASRFHLVGHLGARGSN